MSFPPAPRLDPVCADRPVRLSAVWVAVGLVAVLSVGAAWLAYRVWHLPDPVQVPVALGPQGWSPMAVGQAAPPMPVMAAPSGVEAVRARLLGLSSFAGTEPAGSWCVAHNGNDKPQLQPCAALRQRFEYYLLALGEIGIEDIRRVVDDEARRAHGDALAAEITALWDRYWVLRNHPWQTPFKATDRSTWMPMLQEQRAMRHQLLGRPWAEAFFADDEQHFEQLYARQESGQPPPPDPGAPVPQMTPGANAATVAAERVALYGEAAAERLARLDDEWADWERRLNAARAERTRLLQSANLSEALRKQEMDRYIQDHFKPEESLRVRSLLRL